MFSRARAKWSRAKWAVLHRVVPWHRYHVIKTDLPPGFHDEDALILHGCMAMLCRFVEWHGGADKLSEFAVELRDPALAEWEKLACALQADHQDEAVAIYRWWKTEHPADLARQEELVMRLYGSERCVETNKGDMTAELRRLEMKIADDERAMLHRLVNIRQGLWT